MKFMWGLFISVHKNIEVIFHLKTKLRLFSKFPSSLVKIRLHIKNQLPRLHRTKLMSSFIQKNKPNCAISTYYTNVGLAKIFLII